MRARRAALLLTAVAAAFGCHRGKAAGRPPVPSGDAIWLSEVASADAPETTDILARHGFAHVFLPVLRLTRMPGAWRAVELALPAAPVPNLPVVLVVEGDAEAAQALLPDSEEAPADAIAVALKRLRIRQPALGRIEGVHLDLPFSEATAETFGAFATRLRAKLPPKLFLTCSLRLSVAEKQREALENAQAAFDGFVAFVFGTGAHADPAATDALGKPWWAGYVPGARGTWTDASGSPRGTLSEKALRAIADDTRVPFGHDLALRQEGAEGFVFRPSATVEVGGLRFSAGDQIAFEQPVIPDLLSRLGADVSGRRHVRGRLFLLDGASEAERVVTLAALSDVLLGRPLLPDLRVAVAAEPGGLRVSAENRSAHASVLSRTTNWVEVDVPSGHIRDVQLGGFDRYEVFDAEGRPVTPGRATRVRLHETLLAPQERIEDAVILFYGHTPEGCCRFRQHVLAASGTELSGDWSAPPAPPTPTPAPVSRKKLRRR
jgi:hypothetical protein